MKGWARAPISPAEWRDFIDQNIGSLLCYPWVSAIDGKFCTSAASTFVYCADGSTFALAMAFAGNDLVNFIGVPLAGLDSYNDYMANANGVGPDSFMMTSPMSATLHSLSICSLQAS